jgi:hypothetical protein
MRKRSIHHCGVACVCRLTISAGARDRGVVPDAMVLSVASVVGVAVLGGAIAAGLTLLIVIAIAGLALVGFANAITVLGQLLDALDD